MGNVLLTMRSRRDWRGELMARSFLDAVLAAGDFLVPEKYDDHEPERREFNPADLSGPAALWTSSIGRLYLKRGKPHAAWLNVKIWPPAAGKFNEILAGFDERYFRSDAYIADFLNAFRILQKWGGFDHAYAVHEDDWNEKNYFGLPTTLTGGRMASSGGLWLEEHLPGIYWLNLFGPVYASFFGETRLAATPAHLVERLSDGSYLVETASSPMEYASPEARARAEGIVNHLGRQAFFDKSNPRKPAFAPTFTFEKAMPGGLTVRAEDPVGTVIPDVAQFISDAPALSAAFCRRASPKLAFSPDDLSRADTLVLEEASRQSDPLATEEARQWLREATAYYGQVLRKTHRAKWMVGLGSGGADHPVVEVSTPAGKDHEYPFTRILRLWRERHLEDGLATRYPLLVSGQLKTAARSLPR
jgi:hypothetical protein